MFVVFMETSISHQLFEASCGTVILLVCRPNRFPLFYKM